MPRTSKARFCAQKIARRIIDGQLGGYKVRSPNIYIKIGATMRKNYLISLDSTGRTGLFYVTVINPVDNSFGL